MTNQGEIEGRERKWGEIERGKGGRRRRDIEIGERQKGTERTIGDTEQRKKGERERILGRKRIDRDKRGG